MQSDQNPFSPPATDTLPALPQGRVTQRRGPLLYFALTGIVSIALTMPLLAPHSFAAHDDPDPIGYLLILFSFPIGGLIFRIRSRAWPIDETVRLRQRMACVATLLLPIAVASLVGLRGQGLHVIVFSGVVSLFLMAGILLSGPRRFRNTTPGRAD